MNRIFTIWQKELKDTLRDRRTVMSSIILPMLLMPAIIVGMGQLAKSQIKGLQDKAVTIGVINEAAGPEIVSLFRQQPNTTIKAVTGDPTNEVHERTLDLAVALPDGFRESINQNAPVRLETYTNSLNDRSGVAFGRLSLAVTQFNDAVLLNRLELSGAGQSVMNKVSLVTKETATEQELGGFGLGFLLPLFIIMWATIGGQYTAVDVSAGEKERKTLEALLLTPARRSEIVLGKFLAVATAALVSVVVALASLYAVFIFGGTDVFATATAGASSGVKFDFTLTPMAIAVMFGISVILVALFSAVNLSVAIFAKSYKEAQSYIGPSYLVIILPVVAFNTLPGFVPSLGYFAIPVVNAVLLFKEVLIGTFSLEHFLLTAGSLAVTAIMALVIAQRIYRRESVLFRD